MLFSLNFVKFRGNFCKVFAAYKQVRDYMAFLYQIAGTRVIFMLVESGCISTNIEFTVP